MSLETTIDLENSSALLGLRDMQRRQLPFAQALALTRTAQAAQAAQKEAIPQRFATRNTFVERGVRIQAATKRRPEAAVFWRAPGGASRRSFAESLARQETGGTKRPSKRYLAIPRNVKRGKGGTITKGQRPKAVLDRKRSFVARAGSGESRGIYTRQGKRGPARLVYFLTPKAARVAPRFEFIDTTLKTARRVYRKEFGRAFAKALASRR